MGTGEHLTLDVDTIFEVSDGTAAAEPVFYTNLLSTVHLPDRGVAPAGSYSFRNPPTFHTRVGSLTRDAQYETDALLPFYVEHQNTAPFVASTLIQRFVTSNPSPRYVKAAATAVKTGSYRSFGCGTRGAV
jgi:cullin-associated NEDD8-dissociated protein 1